MSRRTSGPTRDPVLAELLADPGWQRLSLVGQVRSWLRFARRVIGDDPHLAEDLDLAQRYLDGGPKRRAIHHREQLAERRLRTLDDEAAALQELTLLFLDDHLLDGTAQDVDDSDFLWHLRQVAPRLDHDFLAFVKETLMNPAPEPSDSGSPKIHP